MGALIVIRGNSDSGKSTVARTLRAHLAQQGVKAALVEQDYIRRVVLKEKEIAGGDNIDLIERIVRFSYERGYITILEGILANVRYEAMLARLCDVCMPAYLYYMEVSFEEMLRRHATKPNAREFGEAEMRKWYSAWDATGLPGESVIAESSSVYETLSLILRKAGFFV